MKKITIEYNSKTWEIKDLDKVDSYSEIQQLTFALRDLEEILIKMNFPFFIPMDKDIMISINRKDLLDSLKVTEELNENSNDNVWWKRF